MLLILSLFEPSTANAQATNDMPDTHKLGMALDYFAGGKYHEALMMFLKIDKKYKLNLANPSVDTVAGWIGKIE